MCDKGSDQGWAENASKWNQRWNESICLCIYLGVTKELVEKINKGGINVSNHGRIYQRPYRVNEAEARRQYNSKYLKTNKSDI